METVLEWLRANVDVFGFGVACLIFLITIILVARKVINFWMTLLLLLFALFSGLIIANQNIVKDWFRCQDKKEVSEYFASPDGELITEKE